jgi:toxin ParE1/3/4
VSQSYQFSRAASADLDDIWDYSAENWGEDQAEHYLRQIQNAVARLNDGTAISRSVGNVRQRYLIYGVGSHYLLMRKYSDRVEIVRVLHQSMDIGRWIPTEGE